MQEKSNKGANNNKLSKAGNGTTTKDCKLCRPNKRTFFAPRKDALVVRQPGKGSKCKALDVGRSATAKKEGAHIIGEGRGGGIRQMSEELEVEDLG